MAGLALLVVFWRKRQTKKSAGKSHLLIDSSEVSPYIYPAAVNTREYRDGSQGANQEAHPLQILHRKGQYRPASSYPINSGGESSASQPSAPPASQPTFAESGIRTEIERLRRDVEEIRASGIVPPPSYGSDPSS